MRNDVFENSGKKCSEIQSELDKTNSEIRVYEGKIEDIRRQINALGRDKEETRASMRDNMVKLGRSKDLVVNAFIPNPYVAIGSAVYDMQNAPREEDINAQMDRIREIEGQIGDQENEIFKLGVTLRELLTKRDDLMRTWRFLGCSRG